ncbi:MAG: DNA polymerase/3'-5' exonuclease PolX [Gemmatimonadota bacterium]
MDNTEVARRLDELADLLEIQGSNPFRIRAYRNAIRTIQGLTQSLQEMVAREEDLTALQGIGKDISAHIHELLETGGLALLDEVVQEVPRELTILTQLEGVGPKKVARLWRELGVVTVDDLEAAVESGRVEALDGFGAKSASSIHRAIQDFRKHQGRFLRMEAAALLEGLLDHLRDSPELQRLEVAGSFRRGMDTVGDIDLLALVENAPVEGPGESPSPGEPLPPLMERFITFPGVERVDRSGPTRGRVVLSSGLSVDLRILPQEVYGAALHYFTGSKEHNVELRSLARDRGLKISEYGVFKEEKRVGGATEEEIFQAVDLPWIPPVLREGRGELAAATEGGLPQLVEMADIRGDLHMHSTWSDGKNTLEEMVEACVARKYAYMAITDHSRSLGVANGLSIERLRQQSAEVERLQEAFPGIRILKGSEVDILKDGSLDFPDEVLEELDIVVAAVHTHFQLRQSEMTERIIRALSHPQVDILAHPTGRLLNRREPYAVDVEAVLEAAGEYDVAVEMNANPHRLDLHDRHLFRARELGLKVAVDTDAHRVTQLDFMESGLEQAKRGWLESQDVVNTLDLVGLEGWLGRC